MNLYFIKNIKISILLLIIGFLLLWIQGMLDYKFLSENLFQLLAAYVASIIFCTIVINYYAKHEISISSNGINIPEWNNMHIEWNELKFELKEIKYFKLYKILRVVIYDSNKVTHVEYDFTDIDIFLRLIKQNCPPNHDFYLHVEKYAKEKNLTF